MASRPPSDRRFPIHYRVEMRPAAYAHLSRIHAFIARTHPMNADRYIEKIRFAVAGLSTLPKAWPRMRQRGLRDIHQRSIGSHRILFRVDDPASLVVIIAVIDGRSQLTRTIRQVLMGQH